METPYNINLTGASNDTLFQAYCLNPPSDSCEFGPCPNPDVTGIGQQVSCELRPLVQRKTIDEGLKCMLLQQFLVS
jgi:hypothetical protein